MIISFFERFIIIQFFISPLFLTASLFNKSEMQGLSEPTQIVYQIINETSLELSKKYLLRPIGLGVNKGYEYLEISFQIFEPLSKDEARIILLDSVRIFIENVNNSNKLKPYLKKNPYSIEEVGIVIYIRGKNNEDLVHPRISIASLTRGELRFSTNDPENLMKFKERTKETYEEALAHVEKARQLSENKN